MKGKRRVEIVRQIITVLLIVAFILALKFESSFGSAGRSALVLVTVVLAIVDLVHSVYSYRAKNENLDELIVRIVEAICFVSMGIVFWMRNIGS